MLPIYLRYLLTSALICEKLHIMQEIEVKILQVNKPEMLAKLAELGAEKHFEGELYAIFWDTKDSNFREKKQALRLRKEGEEVALTFKSPISLEAAKIMEELEVKVSDFEVMRKILMALGYEHVKSTRKIREEYLLQGTKIVFDQYLDDLGYIPLFIEIEAADLESLYKVVNLLGYTEVDCKNWNTYEIADYYKNK